MVPTVDSWRNNPVELGPLYPLVGYEFVMFVACAAALLGFLVWKFRSEDAHYGQMVAELKHNTTATVDGNLTSAVPPSREESHDANP